MCKFLGMHSHFNWGVWYRVRILNLGPIYRVKSCNLYDYCAKVYTWSKTVVFTILDSVLALVTL